MSLLSRVFKINVGNRMHGYECDVTDASMVVFLLYFILISSFPRPALPNMLLTVLYTALLQPFPPPVPTLHWLSLISVVPSDLGLCYKNRQVSLC